MVKVTFLSNPFDTDKKTILEAPYTACKTVQGYIKCFVDDYPDTKFHISINGHVLEDTEINTLCPAIGDDIVILPVIEGGVKNFLRSVAMIALSVYVGGLNASFFVKAAAMYVGGRIINAILPPPKLTGPESQNISPTYGWEGAKPIAATGTPIGRTFGTVKPAPVVLARHITTDGDKQYLNILYGGGEGPIDSVDNITIEGNPIANYKDVQVDIRLGTNDQEPIPNFGDTFADQSLNYELLSDSWATQQTEGNAGEGLELTVELPGGLYHVKNDGGLENATVKVKAQFRKVGDTDWIDWPLIDDGQTDAFEGQTFLQRWMTMAFIQLGKITLSKYNGMIVAAKNTAVRRVYRMDGLEPAKYEVRCQCYYKSGTDTRYGTRVYWSQLSHVIYNDFARPGKVLVGIKALATDQLSGSDPDVGWTQTRDNANVWNPNTAQYEKKPLTNPYWACYDMIHNCKYLKNINTGQYEYVIEGNPVSRIDYPAFAENAAYSAELDSAGDPRFELNLYLDTNISFWDALARIAIVGRGVIIPKGTKYSCICDKPAIPTQLFTMGNITEKSLKGKFQSTKDRSQSIEVEFFNKQKDYKQDLAIYYGDDWDNTARVPNPTKVTRWGITKYKYAYRDAVFLFKGNKYLKRTENWEADIDAIACKPGDVVLLQHDVPRWGLAGGRIVSATENTVTIDKEVALEAGKTYAIEIRLLDDSRVNRMVQSVAGNVLTLATPFTDIPARYDVYAFGEANKVTKPFKVINIVKSKDLQCKLTGIEYIEDMYSDVIDIPIINYSALDTTLAEVTGLSIAQETYRQRDGTVVSVIHAGWDLSRSRAVYEYQVSYSQDNGLTWVKWDNTKDTNIAMSGVKALETYLIKVCTVNELGVVSNGVISEPVYVTGKDAPPSDVLSITAVADQSDSTKITLAWPAITDVDLNGYRLSEGSTVLTPTPISDTRYIYTATTSRQHNFSVVAVDNSGNPSQVPATTTINIIIEPAQVAGFSVVAKDTDRSRLAMSWNPNSESDLSYYELRHGDNWDTASIIATQLKATNFELQLSAEGSQAYMIKAFNIAGHGSTMAAQKILQITLRPDAPTNLTAVQEPRDRSMVKVTWTPSTGHDIAGYELKYGDSWDTGTAINTATDCQYWWYVPASGTYNIMVKAKTVAGYYSNVANVSITAMIEAYDVIGFSATQSISNRTKVTLSWDNPISQDVSYFTIKKGATWDTGIVIAPRASGTFYDCIVKDETEQTFWIKAVTVAGKESQNPAKVDGIFNMNPSPVSNIQMIQNTNDKSILNIMWLGVSEADLVGYQVKIGQTWESAEALPLTQELYCAYALKQTGDIKVMIKTTNAAGFYSDEVSAHLYCTVEPLDVTGLVAYQNGETVELYWDKAAEADVTAYEIREGANFDQGSLVATGVTQASYVAAVDTERTYQWFVKAINRSGHYSQRAASKAIFVANLPVKNVIETFDEIALANGVCTNVEFGESLINFSNMGGKFSDYPTTKFSDVGGHIVLKLLKSNGSYPTSGTYAPQQIDVGQVITANITARFVSTVILRGTGSAVLQLRTSQNGTNWIGWQDFKPVQYTFRYAEFRVLLGTTDTTKTPEVNQFTISIDVPDTDIAKTVTVPIGGITVDYGHTFYTLPILTPMAIGEGLHAELVSKTKANCVVKVKNTANVDTGGQCDLRGKGY